MVTGDTDVSVVKMSQRQFIHAKSHKIDSGSNSSLRGKVPSNNRLSDGKFWKHEGEQ
jgi:hypothetical protein